MRKMKQRKRESRDNEIEVRRKYVNEILLECVRNPKTFAECANELKRRNIDELAIYGAGVVGKTLAQELVKKDFHVAYLIDKFSDEKKIDGMEILHYRMDYLRDVDALIVTPCHEKDFIYYEIEDYYSAACDILFLDELMGVII